MHELFIGHVREPVVADLKFIATDLDLEVIDIIGRNWLGLRQIPESLQMLGRCVSKPLELLPAFCSDIYLVSIRNK